MNEGERSKVELEPAEEARTSRRDVLDKLKRSAAYAAPVLITLAVCPKPAAGSVGPPPGPPGGGG